VSLLAGCAAQVPPNALDTSLAPVQTNLAQTNLQNCRDFTTQVAVEGQTLQGAGQTCLQPDGSWRVTLNTPGLPEQTYTLPPQGVYPYPYPYPYTYTDPSYWADPWFYGPLFVGNRVVLVGTFHHHHFHQGGYHQGGSQGGHK
jgi:hypothetical protein